VSAAFKPTIKNGDEKQKKSINVLREYSMRLERHAEEPPENHMQNQAFHRCGSLVRASKFELSWEE